MSQKPQKQTTVVNIHHGKPYDVYIGRGRNSPWGNPFSHLPGTLARFQAASRAEAVARFREWILDQPQLLARLPELQGKVLGCFCKPAACHGDVLAELADCSGGLVHPAASVKEADKTEFALSEFEQVLLGASRPGKDQAC